MDSEAVDRFLGGDERAFDALVQRHRQRIFDLVYRMTNDRDWAEDITVDVLVEVFRSLPKFQKRAKFSTWLHRVALNVCLQSIRQRKARKYLAEVPLEEAELAAVPDPAQSAGGDDSTTRVMAAMQTLPEVHRAAVTMFYLEERSCAEIAEILNIPRNTAKTRIFYATRVLRDNLRAQGIIPQSRGHRSEVR